MPDPLVILSDTTWHAGSVHDLTGQSVQIAPGVTLTIESGAVIKGGAIGVYGSLVAQGSAGSTIEMQGVAIYGAGGAARIDLDHIHMDGGVLGAVNLTLTNSVVEDVSAASLFTGGSLHVEGNLFLRSAGFNVNAYGADTALFRNNTFVEQTTDFAIRSNNAPSATAIIVEGNNFLSTDRIALTGEAPMQIQSNYFGTTNPAAIDAMVRDRSDNLLYPYEFELVDNLPTSNPDAPAYSRVSVTAGDATKREGDSGTTSFSFSVVRIGDASVAQTVSYAVTSSSTNGVSASDFANSTMPSGVISFSLGETSKVVTIQVAADSVLEADEGFTVTLMGPSPGMVVGTAAASGTILNDDAEVSIAAVSGGKPEGQAGGTAYEFTVTRTGDTSTSQSVSWMVAGSGASAAGSADFVGGKLPSGVVTFLAGETSRVVTVQVAGDTIIEANETFSISLVKPSPGVRIVAGSAAGTIVNDDVPTPTSDTLTGTSTANTLEGFGGNDSLAGLAGNDRLDGGAGADTMLGGEGNDTYAVDDAGDVVSEAGGRGVDLVESSVRAF